MNSNKSEWTAWNIRKSSSHHLALSSQYPQ
jgi:hypothetical protein